MRTEKDFLPSVHQSPSFERMVRFEDESWPEKERASHHELIQRMEDFPDGIFMLNHKGEDVAQVTVSPKHIPNEKEIVSFQQMRDLPVDKNSSDLWITNIARKQGEQYEKKGYVTQLLEEVIAWAKHRGYKTIQAEVTCDGFAHAYKNGFFISSKTGESLEADDALREYFFRDMNPGVKALRRAAEHCGVSISIGGTKKNYWPENDSSAGRAVHVVIGLVGKAESS